MRALTQAQTDALEARTAMRRWFLQVDALDSEGAADTQYFWSDAYSVQVSGDIYVPGLARVDSLNAVSSLSIPGLSVVLDLLQTEVENMVRGKTIEQRTAKVFLGIFVPETHQIIGDLIPHFDGIVDKAPITTPAAGGEGKVELKLESSSRALTVKRTGTKSPSTQRDRDSDDAFYDNTAGVPQKTIYFGRPRPKST